MASSICAPYRKAMAEMKRAVGTEIKEVGMDHTHNVHFSHQPETFLSS